MTGVMVARAGKLPRATTTQRKRIGSVFIEATLLLL
jgi:hypothetical protein